MITLHEISDLTTYKNALYDTIKRIEEKQVELAPYVDPNGIPSIGIGFNLRDSYVRQAVFDTLGIVDASIQQQLTNTINATYAPGDNSALQSALGASFRFSSETEVRTTFNKIIGRYESRLDARLGGTPILNSFERIALVSLVYQSTNNITNEFIRAYRAGDRAEVLRT